MKRKLIFLSVAMAMAASVAFSFAPAASAYATCTGVAVVPRWHAGQNQQTNPNGSLTPYIDGSCSQDGLNANVCIQYKLEPSNGYKLDQNGNPVPDNNPWTTYVCGGQLGSGGYPNPPNGTEFAGPQLNCDSLSSTYAGATWRTYATITSTDGGGTGYLTSPLIQGNGVGCAAPTGSSCNGSGICIPDTQANIFDTYSGLAPTEGGDGYEHCGATYYGFDPLGEFGQNLIFVYPVAYECDGNSPYNQVWISNALTRVGSNGGAYNVWSASATESGGADLSGFLIGGIHTCGWSSVANLFYNTVDLTLSSVYGTTEDSTVDDVQYVPNCS